LSFNPPGVIQATSVGTAMLTAGTHRRPVVAMSSSNPVAVIPSSVTVLLENGRLPASSSGAVTIDTDVASDVDAEPVRLDDV
jgi:hypothetical protein